MTSNGAQDLPEIVDGRYKLVKPIGQGGMAAVWLVWDQRLRAWRALKLLLPAHAQDAGLRRRFESEAQAMARLEHPNVVRVYDVALEGEIPYISMELVDGGSLDGWVKRNGAMPPRLAVEATLQVCAGISAAHDEGIIHRDVKPHNILVDRKGVCKVTDFGIARVEDEGDLTQTGAVMGTMGFMAPEQRMDTKLVDERADVYSIGSTLFSLLTGRKKVGDLFAAEDHELVDLGVPPAVGPILLRATRYRREQRYESVEALARALREVLPGLPSVGAGVTLVTADARVTDRTSSEVGDPISFPSRPSARSLATGTPAPAPEVLSRPGAVRGPPTRTPLEIPPPEVLRRRTAPPKARTAPPVGATAVPTDELLDEVQELIDAAAPAPGGVVYEDVGDRAPRGARHGAKDFGEDLPPPPAEAPREIAPDPTPALVESGTPAPASRPPDRPAPAPAEDDEREPLRALLLPLAGVTAIVLLLSASYVGYTMYSLGSTAEERHSAAVLHATEDALFAVVEDEVPKLNSDLAELGPRPAMLEKLFADFQREGDPAARVRLATQIVAVASTELDARSKDAPATRSYKIPEARQRLVRLQNARSSYDVAMQKLEAARVGTP